jgi:hypothetical protein
MEGGAGRLPACSGRSHAAGGRALKSIAAVKMEQELEIREAVLRHR